MSDSDKHMFLHIGDWGRASTHLKVERDNGYGGIPPRMVTHPHAVLSAACVKFGCGVATSVRFGREYSPVLYFTALPLNDDVGPLSLGELRAMAKQLKKAARSDEASAALEAGADDPAGNWRLRIRLWWD